MNTSISRPQGLAIAHEVPAAMSSGQQIAPLSTRIDGFDVPAAYAATAELRQLRCARGEIHVGRKVGFSDRTIWAEYGVFAPIWGDMCASAVHDLAAGTGSFPLAGRSEPRIEPEIAFGACDRAAGRQLGRFAAPRP